MSSAFVDGCGSLDFSKLEQPIPEGDDRPENGFNVARALVGTEGTCALTLQAKVRLVKSPSQRAVLVLGFPDIYVAADAVPEYQRFAPIAIEGLDRAIIRGLQARKLRQAEIDLLPAGDAWVMLEFGADSLEAATAQAQRAADYFAQRPSGPVPSAWLVADAATQKRIWSIRETGASATQLSIDPDVPDPQVGREDAAVDPNRLGHYLREFQALVDRYGFQTSLGPQYKVVNLATRLQFRSAEGDGFQRGVERCVGMGKCRSSQAGTMCPSYRATKEERFCSSSGAGYQTTV